MTLKMIKIWLLLLTTIIATALSAPRSTKEFELAKPCSPDDCKLPDCRCSSTEIPGNLNASTIPQLVLFTFDDAVTEINFLKFEETFFGRKNPDGCPIGVTHFVSHEYTDYSKVHELHSRGHEIALHSISHESNTTYWRTLSVRKLTDEFHGEKRLISHFANIPYSDILGGRLPLLQLSGNNSYKAFLDSNLKYDCSWPTLNYRTPGLWPYTLDYKSIQECPIPPCPTASLPGMWVVPMIDWKDDAGYECSMVDACVYIPTDVEGVLAFMIRNFNVQYEGNRAPFGVYLHAAWFEKNAVYYEAFKKFVDYLQGLDDVYLVNIQRALDWIRKPSQLGDLNSSWPKCQKTNPSNCPKPLSCCLQKEERCMTICTDACPDSYPWLGQPLG